MLIDEIPYLNDLPEDVREFVARVLLVILALLLIWLMRRIMTWVIIRPLKRMAKRTGHEFDDDIVEAAVRPIRFIVIAIGIMVSAEILDLGTSIDAMINHIGRSVLIFGMLLLVYQLIDLFMPSSNRLFAITGITIEDRLLPFARTAIKLVIIAVGLVILLQEWGYDVSGVVAGLGLGGLAFSLAAQDTLANLFAFASIVSDRPFNVGEFIKTPDVEGVVENVGLRSTQIRRLDQSIVYVPNSVMANSAILNWSRLKKRRLDMTLGITYNATSEQIRVLLHRIRNLLKEHPATEDGSSVVYFTNFGASSLDILIRAYMNLADWGEFTSMKENLNLAIMDIVTDLGMSIAFPSQSLYIENLPESLTGPKPSPTQPELTDEEQALVAGKIEEPPQRLTQDSDEAGEQQDMPDGDAV
jgi:MscS family membrane protein